MSAPIRARAPAARNARVSEHPAEPQENSAKVAASAIQAFRICGHVDDVRMVAVWTPEYGLLCPPALRQRAQIVVALEDTFEPRHGTPRMTAAIDGPDASAILLTVVRAFSEVTSVVVHR
jgi:hypothetical protein